MAIKRMDNVLIVVDDLEAAKAFFIELGLTLEGEQTVEGPLVGKLIGLKEVRATVAMMRTPDGQGIELDKFYSPSAIRFGPMDAPVNTLGIRRIMFAVDDIDAIVAHMHVHGAELIGEMQYGDTYRLAYIRGPEGIIVALAEQLGRIPRLPLNVDPLSPLMFRTEIHNTVGKAWTDMEPIRVGPVPTGRGTPGAYVTIDRDGEPYARVDAWPLLGGPFVECIVWREYVVLGWGGWAHLIDPLARDTRSIEFEIYFGHFYPLAEKLLITSESDLTCVNAKRAMVWRSGRLGIDGVVIDRVVEDFIIGKGEWDPPGGWQLFRLSLQSGESAAR